MSDYIVYALIGAGIAFVFFVLIKLITGREKKSRAYSMLKGQQPFAQSTELYDTSLETKRHIKAASLNFKMIGEIIPLLEEGNKISAIKYVQEKEQMSLRDAKAFVDQAEEVMHKMPGMFNFKENGETVKEIYKTDLSVIDAKIKALIERGSLIAAIKVYRDATDSSLADAKQYCEDFARKNNLQI
jgi:ribosomal protein L7/L12